MSLKNKKILSRLISVIIILVVLVPLLIQAQNTTDTTVTSGASNSSGGTSLKITLKNPFKSNSIEGLLKVIVDEILMPIGGVIAVLMIMYAGYLFVTARGNSAQIDKARDALVWAVVGAAILLGAWVISTAIGSTIRELKSGS